MKSTSARELKMYLSKFERYVGLMLALAAMFLGHELVGFSGDNLGLLVIAYLAMAAAIVLGVMTLMTVRDQQNQDRPLAC